MQLSRKELKVLKLAARNRDRSAVRKLLAHSVSLGHKKLAVKRWIEARMLGEDDLVVKLHPKVTHHLH